MLRKEKSHREMSFYYVNMGKYIYNKPGFFFKEEYLIIN